MKLFSKHYRSRLFTSYAPQILNREKEKECVQNTEAISQRRRRKISSLSAVTALAALSLFSLAKPAKAVTTTLNFNDSSPVLVSGTDKSQGAVYRFRNVTSGVDALVTISQINNSTLVVLDDNSSLAARFQPTIRQLGSNATSYIRFDFQLVASNTNTPVFVPNVYFSAQDTDGNGTANSVREFVEFINGQTSYVANPTLLGQVTALAGGVRYQQINSSNVQPGIGTDDRYEFYSYVGTSVSAFSVIGGSSSGSSTCSGASCDRQNSWTFNVVDAQRLDFGDAPLSYGDASHPVPLSPTVFFGASVDGDDGPTYTVNADGDGADENGIASFPSISANTSNYSVTLACSANGIAVAGWIDFNRDGSFSSGERTSSSCNSGSVTLNWAGLSGLSAGTTYARFRVASIASEIVNSTGSASNGEVEDYRLTINTVPPTLDLDGNNSSGVSGNDYQNSFNPGVGLARAIDLDVDIAAGSGFIDSAIITLTNRPDGSNESLNIDVTAGGTVTGVSVTNYNPATGVLALTSDISGTITLDDYEAILATLAYDNVAATVAITNRIINVQVTDSNAQTSNTATSTINVTGATMCNNRPIVEMSFRNPVREDSLSIGDFEAGAVHRFSDVAPGVDALVTVIQFNNGATLGEIDDAVNGSADALQPSLNSSDQSDSSVDFNISFVEAGTSIAKDIRAFNASGVDIDGDNSSLREYIELEYFSRYLFEDPTNLKATINSPAGRFESEVVTVQPGISTNATQTLVTAEYENVNSFRYRIGALRSSGSSGTRLNSLSFSCIQFNNPTVNNTTVNAPNVLLVKRITAINGDRTQNPNDGTPLNQFIDDTVSANQADDNEAGWPNSYLLGEFNAGLVKPGDEIEYTIYFLNAGGNNADDVRICDRIQPNQAFQPNAYGSGADIQLQLGTSAVLDLTAANDAGDRAELIAANDTVPATCSISGSNTDGTLVIDITGANGTGNPSLTTLPASTGVGTPNDSYGFFRFTTRVN